MLRRHYETATEGSAVMQVEGGLCQAPRRKLNVNKLHMVNITNSKCITLSTFLSHGMFNIDDDANIIMLMLIKIK